MILVVLSPIDSDGTLASRGSDARQAAMLPQIPVIPIRQHDVDLACPKDVMGVCSHWQILVGRDWEF